MKRPGKPATKGWELSVVAAALALWGGVAHAGLLGVQAVPEEPLYLVGNEPVTLLLSKSKYPAEDLHLDAIVWLQPAEGAVAEGELSVALLDERGEAIGRDTIRPLPGKRVFFSVAFPPELAGRDGALQVAWVSGGREMGRAEGTFAVLPSSGVKTSGRVRLRVPNDHGATLRGAPMTVGVPFPRGALPDDSCVRLVDAEGREIPLQTKVTSRWSRFGSIRWLQCDFAADVAGAPLELFLEYGPEVKRQEATGLRLRVADRGAGAPLIEASPIRFGGDGIEFDAGDGRGFRRVVTPESLSGAFVEHENGKRFFMPADAKWEIEERGTEKVLLRRRGWYVQAGTGERFCQFDTRYIVQRGSPVVRMFHTWIFTGYPYEDLYKWVSGKKIQLAEGAGDADRIRNMGWRFGLQDGMTPEGFLSSYEAGGAWRRGNYLLQHDYDKHEVVAGSNERVAGERAAGVASAAGGGTRLLLGVKDFWQNYPNELEFADSALFFHQWPRHGKPARTHPPEVKQGLRLWFAHEGESLDFAIPKEYTDDPAFQKANPRGYHLHGQRETMNAQGIAKTDEIWLLFTDDNTPPAESAKALAGLNDGTLRTTVEPKWIAASGAFFEMHPKDVENYAEEERIYELHALAPLKWIERLRFYGKWIWGDVWWCARLRQRDWGTKAGLYRGLRKSHQGWPYSWIPFARSGDPRFLRLADAATRHMTDAVFCHYSDERVPPWRAGASEETPIRPRWRGFHLDSTSPGPAPPTTPGRATTRTSATTFGAAIT